MKEKIIVNIGDKSGRLTVTGVGKTRSGIYLNCVCSCGKEKVVYKGNFVSGRSKSCGCYSREVTSKTKKTHGKSNSKIYAIWNNMLTRCYNPKSDRYLSYGGRGISVCDSWRDRFENFYRDMGDIPSPIHTIGRKDNDGNYCPQNCRWETPEQQSSNTTRSLKSEISGELMTAKQISDKFNVPYSAVSQRIRAGRSGDDLLQDHLGLKMIKVDGVEKPTTHWMKEAGIPISSFYYHLRNGKSKEDIVRMYLARKSTKQK